MKVSNYAEQIRVPFHRNIEKNQCDEVDVEFRYIEDGTTSGSKITKYESIHQKVVVFVVDTRNDQFSENASIVK